MTSPWEIVVVSSDFENRQNLTGILARQGSDPIAVSTLQECREILAERPVGLVFCDSRLSDGTYQELLASYRAKDAKPRVVITSHHNEWEEFKEAMRLGAFDVIGAPCRPTDVEWMVIQAKRDERSRTDPFPRASIKVPEPARAVAAKA